MHALLCNISRRAKTHSHNGPSTIAKTTPLYVCESTSCTAGKSKRCVLIGSKNSEVRKDMELGMGDNELHRDAQTHTHIRARAPRPGRDRSENGVVKAESENAAA